MLPKLVDIIARICNLVELAFTTRIPLAVMIAMGIKQWENHNAMRVPAKGRCAMTCSKSSDAKGVRQLPRLGGEGVQTRGIRRTPTMGRGERLARDAGRRLRLRGVVHRAESAHLGRRLPRLVAINQCASA